MVTGEEDCSCTDTTEPSNVTLRSDEIPSAVNAELNVVCTETTEHKATNSGVEGHKDTNYKCPDTLPATNYCVAETEATSTVPAKLQQKNLKTHVPTTQFQPSLPCLCRSHKINGYLLPVKLKEDKVRQFWNPFHWKRSKKTCFRKDDKMYEIKLKQTQCPHYAKVRPSEASRKHRDVAKPDRKLHDLQPFVCCEISEGIPSKSNKCEVDKWKTPKSQPKVKPKKEEITEKIDIYYFDHGNSAYYRTTDCHPVLITDKCAEKTDQAATRFWAEFFGTIHIGTAFVTAFILQFLRFVLYSIIRPLTVGILQLIGDYFIKPLLSIIFNALIQPVLILFYNIATSLKDLCEPIAGAMGLFLREIANLCAAIRIVEVKHIHAPTTAAA